MGELDFTETHRRSIAQALYGEDRTCRIDLIRPHTELADSVALYLVDDAYVLSLSAPAFPDSAAQETRAVRAMRLVLGEAGRVLPVIAGEGLLDERSFRLVPLLKPLRTGRLLGRIDRLRVRGAALAWVRELAARAEPPSGEAPARFIPCLAALAATPGLPDDIAAAAEDAQAALETGRVQVGHVPMHGDLWVGNLLRTAQGALCVIDWGGSERQGYGLFDLMRLGESLRLPPGRFGREIAAHEALLGGRAAARIHLLAALGHYAANLGQFPLERFVTMATSVWRHYGRH